MKGCKEASEIIMTSLAEWGRTSFFEDWTKLDVLLSKCSTPTEIQWAFEMLYHTRKAKLRTSNYSRDELQKKTSDLFKWLLTQKLVHGLSRHILAPVVTVLEQASKDGEFKAQIDAVRNALSTTSTAASFLRDFPQGGASCPDGGVSCPDGASKTWVDALPTFLVTDFIPLLKKIMHGKFDNMLVGLLTHPPKGGWTMINYNDHLQSTDGIADPLKNILKAFEEWKASVQGSNGSRADDLGQTGDAGLSGGDGAQAGEAGHGLAPQEAEDGEDATSARIRDAMARQARENSSALVSMCVAPGSAKEAENLIRASGVYQKLSSGPPPHRISFAYSVSDAYDRKPPRAGEFDRRMTAASPVWTADLSMFLEAVSPFVTPENQNFLAILSGSNKRPGSGLLTEAGLGNNQDIINLVRKASGKHGDADPDGASLAAWRVKTFSVNVNEDSFWGGRVKQRRGISGSLNQTLFFFYRGSWPNGLPKEGRAFFGGTTWGDTWSNVPAPAVSQLPLISIETKQQLFQEVWAQLGPSADASVGLADEPVARAADDEPPAKRSKATKASTQEIFMHRDNHIDVWKQISREWRSRGCIFWTIGCGTGLMANLQERKPSLGLALNQIHIDAVNDVIVKRCLNMMTSTSTSWLHDKALHSKYIKALEVETKAKKDKKKENKAKDKKKKGTQQKKAKKTKKKQKKDKKEKKDKKAKKESKAKKVEAAIDAEAEELENSSEEQNVDGRSDELDEQDNSEENEAEEEEEEGADDEEGSSS